MLWVANALLAIAVFAGTVLALWHMRSTEPGQRPPRAAGVAHGLVGSAGFAAFLFVEAGPPRATAAGAGQFGLMASVLFGLALLASIPILLLRRPVAVIIAVHAGMAICAYVLFLAWSSLG